MGSPDNVARRYRRHDTHHVVQKIHDPADRGCAAARRHGSAAPPCPPPSSAATPRRWHTIAGTPNLDWLLLTKCPQNLRKMLPISPPTPGSTLRSVHH